MSFEIRDCTSPVRVRVKKASEQALPDAERPRRAGRASPAADLIREQRLNHAEHAGHDCDRDHPAGVERERSRVVRQSLRTCWSRKAGMTPSPAETTISRRTPPSRSLYGAKSGPMRRRFARRTDGSAGPLGRCFGRVKEHAHSGSEYVARWGQRVAVTEHPACGDVRVLDASSVRSTEAQWLAHPLRPPPDTDGCWFPGGSRRSSC